MIHYIISFTVYTLAMSGLIALALYVYKKVMTGNLSGKNSKLLSIEETMAINPRKTLMIVKAGEERFLIASDIDKTSLIAKLGQDESVEHQNHTAALTEKEKSFVDLSEVKTSIESKNIDVLFPNKDKRETEKVKKDPKVVHFESINGRNPYQIRQRRQPGSGRRHNVTIEVGQVRNHGLSTIKEIAQKVNEL